MTELTFAILKYGFLALLWVFVWLVVRSLRNDVVSFSPKTSKKHRRRARQVRQAAHLPASQPAAAPTPTPVPEPSPSTASSGPTILVIIDGPLAGTTIPLSGGQITLGRAPGNTITLDDEFVSSHHARIFRDTATGQRGIEDLGSTNGTVVNNQKLTGATLLPARVPVRIGATTFELR